MDDIRPFPIQGEGLRRKPFPYRPKASTIPWWLATVAYKWYSYCYGDSQSMERLAERGGFGRDELVLYFRKSQCGLEAIETAPDDHLPFPIKGSDVHEPCTIPWWLAKVAWESYRKWPGATLEQLAEEGGFTRGQLVRLLREFV